MDQTNNDSQTEIDTTFYESNVDEVDQRVTVVGNTFLRGFENTKSMAKQDLAGQKWI